MPLTSHAGPGNLLKSCVSSVTLSIFLKCLYVVNYSNVKTYVSPNQRGFVSGRFTVSNIAAFTQYLSQTVDMRRHADVVCTDYT